MSKPKLFKASFEFYQEGNTLNPHQVEELVVNIEGEDVEEGNYFFILKTETGWSIDNSDELVEVIDRVKQIIEK